MPWLSQVHNDALCTNHTETRAAEVEQRQELKRSRHCPANTAALNAELHTKRPILFHNSICFCDA